MKLTPSQEYQFEQIRTVITLLKRELPDYEYLTVGEADPLYKTIIRRKIIELITVYCPQEDNEAVRNYSYKFYNL